MRIAYVSQREILTEFAYGVLMRCTPNGRMVDPAQLTTPHIGCFTNRFKRTRLYAPALMKKILLVMRHPDAQARDVIMRNTHFCSTGFVHAPQTPDNSAQHRFRVLAGMPIKTIRRCFNKPPAFRKHLFLNDFIQTLFYNIRLSDVPAIRLCPIPTGASA